MVKLRRPSVPESIVVKPARRRRSAAVLRAPQCIWPDCHAQLAHDHEGPICGCHVDRRIPHHRSDRLVLHLLLAAYPCAIDLCTVLHCSSHELEATLRRLKRRGHAIAGARRGYVYELTDSQWR
jgi:hypothetical protein